MRHILLIATAVFYYDLRVRKEAFDLQSHLMQVRASRNPKCQAPNLKEAPNFKIQDNI